MTPFGVALDASRDLYIADESSSFPISDYHIRMVTSGGTISTVAGNGNVSYSGDGQTATGAQFNNPSDVATDAAGNLYIADSFNNVVRAVNTQSTTVTLLGVTIPPGDVATVAGNESLHNCSILTNECFGGDGGPATSAELDLPEGVALDGAGNLYIADAGNARVREVNLNGIISTVAGNGDDRRPERPGHRHCA
jgi:trimeric autotransporter adhesin